MLPWQTLKYVEEVFLHSKDVLLVNLANKLHLFRLHPHLQRLASVFTDFKLCTVSHCRTLKPKLFRNGKAPNSSADWDLHTCWWSIIQGLMISSSWAAASCSGSDVHGSLAVTNTLGSVVCYKAKLELKCYLWEQRRTSRGAHICWLCGGGVLGHLALWGRLRLSSMTFKLTPVCRRKTSGTNDGDKSVLSLWMARSSSHRERARGAEGGRKGGRGRTRESGRHVDG